MIAIFFAALSIVLAAALVWYAGAIDAMNRDAEKYEEKIDILKAVINQKTKEVFRFKSMMDRPRDEKGRFKKK